MSIQKYNDILILVIIMKEKINKFSLVICIILLIAFAIYLIADNEKNYYEAKQLANEIKNSAITIKDGKVNKNNNDKLVFIFGKIDYDNQVLVDEVFDVNVKTPRLLRFVEVYQWDRYKKNNEYIYYKKWSSELIDSTDFKDHDNPTTKQNGTKYYFADKINVGEFELSDNQKYSLSCNEEMRLNEDLILPSGYIIYKNYITNSKNLEEPEIGDVRVSFSYNNWENITILAKQSNNSFDTYITSDKKEINIIKEGIHTLEEIDTSKLESNKFSKWFLRIIGITMIILSIFALKTLKKTDK